MILSIKFVNFEKFWTWLALTQTLGSMNGIYPIKFYRALIIYFIDNHVIKWWYYFRLEHFNIKILFNKLIKRWTDKFNKKKCGARWAKRKVNIYIYIYIYIYFDGKYCKLLLKRKKKVYILENSFVNEIRILF